MTGYVTAVISAHELLTNKNNKCFEVELQYDKEQKRFSQKKSKKNQAVQPINIKKHIRVSYGVNFKNRASSAADSFSCGCQLPGRNMNKYVAQIQGIIKGNDRIFAVRRKVGIDWVSTNVII